MPNLFQKQTFLSHSGLKLFWKLEADALTQEDLDTIAWLIAQEYRFSEVIGIPTGGLRLAEALKPYAFENSRFPRLIVDDVLTTGESMKKYMTCPKDIGFVIFSRCMANKMPERVEALFYLNKDFI